MDIVEQGRLYIRAKAPNYYEKTVVWKMADEIERLRSKNQELKLQYLSDQGQWIEETGRLRVALERKQRPEAETIDGVIAWIKEDAERLAIARAALGEKE